jgi:hypothetical protein
VNAGATIADIDEDGQLEIIVDNNLYGLPFQLFNHDGSEFTNWTINPLYSIMQKQVTLGDINGDGKLNIITGADDVNVQVSGQHIYDAGVAFNPSLAPVTCYKYNNRNSGEYMSDPVFPGIGEITPGDAVIQISPNPFSNQLNVRFLKKQDGYFTFQIFNLDGKQLYETRQMTSDDNLTIYPEKFPAGMYFYKIESNYFSETGKLIRYSK